MLFSVLYVAHSVDCEALISLLYYRLGVREHLEGMCLRRGWLSTFKIRDSHRLRKSCLVLFLNFKQSQC